MKRILSILLCLGLVLSIGSLSVQAEETVLANDLVVGVDTEIYGDFTASAVWTSDNAPDNTIRALINDYSIVAFDENGAMQINDSVVQSVESEEHEDGTKTYSVTIHEDLLFSDGTPITAKHFVASIALFNHETLRQLGSESYGYAYYVGGEKYAGVDSLIVEEAPSEEETSEESEEAEATEPAEDTDVSVWPGVRLTGDYTFQLTIVDLYNPYFYELSLISLEPLSIAMWLGEGYDLKDDGEGVYWEGDMSVEALSDKIADVRFLAENRVSAGPYKLVSFAKETEEVVLERNEHYKGDFRGQKPSIEKITIKYVDSQEKIEALQSGSVDLISHLTGGKEITEALALLDQGGFASVEFERTGYGNILFQSDFGPTQFAAVRQAIALLIDRDAFMKEFTAEFGTLPSGPLVKDLWQYKETEDELLDRLNPYAYNIEEATEKLVADGWTLNAEGAEWESGVRYKEVTAEQAGDYKLNITLDDGRILMPLTIEWAAIEGNAAAALLSTILTDNADLTASGMQINRTEMTYTELLHWLYREADQGEAYAVPTYGMYNLSSDIYPIYDHSYEWTDMPELIAMGYNVSRLYDATLDQLSMDMVYAVTADEVEQYLTLWSDYVVRWNELLPEIPLYANSYYTVFTDKLKDYNQNPFWGLERAILYATIAE